MYYYSGGDLVTYLDKCKIIHENKAKVIIKQILDAIRFYHSKGVVHRNLSPHNILFKDDNQENIVVCLFC